jgi:hypothetical protein
MAFLPGVELTNAGVNVADSSAAICCAESGVSDR